MATVNKALAHLARLGVVAELTSRRRRRSFFVRGYTLTRRLETLTFALADLVGAEARNNKNV